MKILTLLFDTLFPLRDSQLVLQKLTEKEMVNTYLLQHEQTALYLSSYKDPLLRAVITENKYHGNAVASRHLAVLLEKWIDTNTRPLVLVPIPLSHPRERKRGYNQVTQILRCLPARDSVSIDTTLLKRSRHTTPQTSLDRTARLKNITGAFVCDKEKVGALRDCCLVIIDDVLTTGATMEGAIVALKPHLHPSVTLICLALAH